MSRKEERLNKRRLRSSYLTTIVSITMVLFMVGLLGMIILHAKKLSDYVKENIGFTIMMNENVKEADIMELQKTLDATHYVKSTEYVSSEDAARELENDLGQSFIDFVGFVLPPSIEVKLEADYANPDSLSMIQQEIQARDDVKEMYYQESLIDLVNKNIRKISLFILGFSGLLLIIAIALIHNTIRLSVYARRFIIRTMQLVGATQGFIRRPFVWKGIGQGIISAVIANTFLFVLLYFVKDEFPELINLKDIDMYIILFGFVILCGILLSWISTFFAIRKYLRIKTDRLYY